MIAHLGAFIAVLLAKRRREQLMVQVNATLGDLNKLPKKGKGGKRK